jgi:hypothetical protein
MTSLKMNNITIFMIYLVVQKKSTLIINNMPMKIETVYALEIQSRPLYKQVKLKNLFKKYPKKVHGLTFGYICPGAMKTVDFLNAQGATHQSQVKRIKLLTDFQFFVEMYQIYREYLDESTKLEMMKIIKNNGCKISKTITEEITRLFGELPKKVRLNLPDDFYHIRHNTLVCSKSKTLAKERIELLKSIYGTADMKYVGCHGKRDGCRKCCQSHYAVDYPSCVSSCMHF